MRAPIGELEAGADAEFDERGARHIRFGCIVGSGSVRSTVMARPSGTVTFLFTDVTGSTEWWDREPEAMKEALTAHDEVVRSAIEGPGGAVFSTAGDGFAAAFEQAPTALTAAVEIQLALHTAELPLPLKVRVGLHTGIAEERDGDYFGAAPSRAARVMSVAHGGQILVSAAAADLVRDHLTDQVDLVDLNEHRLRGLERPERIFQITHPDLPHDFPPLETAAAPQNLPSFATSFVGREDERQRVTATLAEHRVVTLTGIGGTGKTRLAASVAEDMLATFSDGVFFVDLAPITEPGRIPAVVAETVGLRAAGPLGGTSGMSMHERIIGHLARRRCLLVVDNCEHLIDACADLVAEFLTRCPHLRLLLTSREPLGVEGEQVWPVPSLPLASAAVELFAERATAANPGFARADHADSVAEICERLDGIPLAIELAAARVAHLSPAEIAERLDERFRLLTGARRRVQRQQTLAAAMDWSWDLLTEDERTLLRRLATFVGTLSLDAAEGTCSDGSLPEVEVLDLLGSLVAKSLVATEVQHDTTRYRLLETVRLYAEEHLVAADEADVVRTRHRDWFLAWAEALPGAGNWIDDRSIHEMATDESNVRAAISWSQARDETDEAIRLTAALLPLWLSRQGYRLDDETYDCLAQAVDASDPRTRACALIGVSLATAVGRQEDLVKAEDFATAALDNDLPEPILGAVYAVIGNWRTVRSFLADDEALFEEGLALLQRGTDLARDDQAWLASAIVHRQPALMVVGDMHSVVDCAEQWVGGQGTEFVTASIVIDTNRAIARFALGDLEGAVEAARRAVTHHDHIGWIDAVFLMTDATVLEAGGRTGDATTAMLSACDRVRDVVDPEVDRADITATIGAWLIAAGVHTEGVRLLGTARREAQRSTRGFHRALARPLYRWATDRAVEELGLDEFRRRRDAGPDLTATDAVELARDIAEQR